MTFRCRACGEHRPEHLISVKKVDSSVRYGFPPGTMQENYQYCSDRTACTEAASKFTTHFPAKTAKE